MSTDTNRYSYSRDCPFDVVCAGLRIHGTASIDYDAESEGGSWECGPHFAVTAWRITDLDIDEPVGMSLDARRALIWHLCNDAGVEDLFMDHIAENHVEPSFDYD